VAAGQYRADQSRQSFQSQLMTNLGHPEIVHSILHTSCLCQQRKCIIPFHDKTAGYTTSLKLFCIFNTVSCPYLVDHLFQLTSKSVLSFSKYCVHKFGNRRMNRRMEGAPIWGGGQHQNITITFSTEKLEWRDYPMVKKSLIICLDISTQYQRVTDRQTARWTSAKPWNNN